MTEPLSLEAAMGLGVVALQQAVTEEMRAGRGANAESFRLAAATLANAERTLRERRIKASAVPTLPATPRRRP